MDETSNYKALYDYSGDAIMLLNEEGFFHCNNATLTIFKCPSIDAFCEKHPSDISPILQPCGRRSNEMAAAYIKQAYENRFVNFEWKHLRFNGEEFYAEVLLNQARWNGEKVIQAVVRDVTHRKLLEEDLKRSRDEADRANRAKSEFLAIMSHEIRTPIHGILSTQELLQQSTLSDEQRQLVEISIDSSQALLETINQILDIAKIESGAMELDPINFYPAAVIELIFQLLSNKAYEKGIEIKKQINHSDTLCLYGDKHKIYQIITNLVGNAIKFTDQGEVLLSSTLYPIADNKYHWTVSIKDTGIGMTSEQATRAFSAFSQADPSVTRRFGGTGLGLSISKGLADALGGHLTVQSSPGNGSTFTLSLELSGQIEEDKSPEVSGLERHYGCSVIVAEDNQVNQLLIKKHLSALGIHCELADNGADAIDLFHRCSQAGTDIKLIFMDIQMPKMSGSAASKALRKNGCTVPIIALTADATNQRRKECLASGMNEFLTKPFSRKSLIETLDKFLP